MMWLASLAFAQTAPVVVPDVDQEITVMGRRMAALSVLLARDPHGKLSCNLSESSGDRAVDAQLCKTAAACFRKGAVGDAAMQDCIDTRKPAILEEFAARVRTASHAGSSG